MAREPYQLRKVREPPTEDPSRLRFLPSRGSPLPSPATTDPNPTFNLFHPNSSGGNNSSLISRPEGLEDRVSDVGSSVGSNLDGLGVTPEEREKAIMEYKPEERKVEGGGGETKVRTMKTRKE